MVARDETSSLVNGRGVKILADSPKMVETLPINFGVDFTLKQSYQRIILAMDSLIVYKEILKSDKRSCWKQAYLAKIRLCLGQDFPHAS